MATDPTGAEIKLGPRSWGKRPATAGFILHTTEYATFSRADAARCIADQSARGPAGEWLQPGSYNWIIFDGGAFLSVPFLEASGGLAPVPPHWQPQRYPWLRQLLPDAAYRDPTMHHLQLAFSGRTVDLARELTAGRKRAQAMVDTAARIVRWAEREGWAADNLVGSGHMHWQDNRSDPSQVVLDAVVRRAVEIGSKPPPTPDPDYEALYIAEVAKVTDLAVKLRGARSGIRRRDTYIGAYPGAGKP
jgi:hypothetical protein